MKTITINVKLKGGMAPIKPTVRILNDETDEIIKIGPKVLSDEKINLKEGRYTVLVNGMNPSGGSAEVSISGTFITGTTSNSKKTTSLPNISALFFITI
jgi:hypothetical protein